MEKKKKYSFKQIVLTFLAALAGYVAAQILGLIATLLFIVAGVLGIFVAKSRAKKKKGADDGLMKFISWSNVATWLVPFIGVFTAFATYQYATVLKEKDKKRYNILATVAIVLSLLNAFAGVAMQL